MDIKNFVSGVIPSPPDYRDYAYGVLVAAETVPARYTCENEFRYPVKNQGKWGTCVGQACASVKELQEARNYPSREPELSPLFVYAECKKVDGIPNQEGTYPRVAMKVLKDIGICKEKLMPYGKMNNPLPLNTVEAMQDAKNYRIGAYARIQTIPELKQAIFQQGPVLAALMVMESIANVGSDGFVPAPGDVRNDRFLGGHAMCVVGWDDNLSNGKHIGYFRVRNSWGTDWGDNGYCWVPYDYFTWRDADMGMPLWMESWSSVDVILPTKEAQKIELWIGKKQAIVDGVAVHLDQAPAIEPSTNRTIVPIRFISEIMGFKVGWEAATRKVTITRWGGE